MAGSAIYSPLKNGPEGPSFRLLTLQPAQESTDPLRCTVVEQPLLKCDDYEALSYCWGDATDKLPIYCNDQRFEATRSLEAALRHLRRKDDDRCLWIDAVCINQDDISERNTQVLLMRSIYRNASRVIVWLGKDEHDSQVVFPLCQRMYDEHSELYNEMDYAMLWGRDREDRIKQKLEEHRLRIADDGDGVEEPRDGDNTGSPPETDEDDDDDTTDSGFHTFLRFLRRPWFQRCWVVQELCLAKEAFAMCGSRLMPWDIFFAGYYLCLLTSKNALTGRPEQIIRGNFLAATSLRLAMTRARDSTTNVDLPDLLGLLWSTRSLEATDPRDKVYSLLGLIPETEADAMSIIPDYAASIEECYLQAATKIIWQSKSLDILTTDRMKNPNLQLDLPSWVPNWSYLSSPAPVSILGVIESWLVDVESDPEPLSGQYRASGSANHCTPQLIGPRTLRLSGYILDSITKMEAVLTVPQGDNEALAANMTSFRGASSFLTNLFTGLGSYFETLVKWEHLAMDKKYDPYPTGESAEEAFASTMSVGSIQDGPITLEQFETWRTTLRWPRKLMKLRYLGAHHLGAAYKIPLAALGMLTSKARGDRTFSTATEFTLYRRLARTKMGYLAVVPADSCPGDPVALFEGCKTPLVLKEKGNQWELVGPAYVHGVMQGEAWDDKRCVSIDLV
ncbi:hypothetical protein V2G26_018904 [Clonostachys chloroleuca]